MAAGLLFIVEVARGRWRLDRGDLARSVRAPRAVCVVTRSLDDTYGPLTAIIALLLWANLTGIVLLAGGRLTAQVEAVRAGTDPLLAHSDDDGTPDEWAGARPR
jgi:hypothetical protein